MRTENIKDVAMKPLTALSGRAVSSEYRSVALHPLHRQWLQSCMMTLMAAMMLGICTSAYSATGHETAAHDAAAHDASKPVTAVQGAHKAESAEKVYPSRAAQDVAVPLAPGATLHKMTLSHHELEPWSFVPKRKDRIEIENRSNITHALYVTYPDGTVVNLEIQIPGDVVSWTVPDDAEGEYVFRCWIHPVIRAKMNIQE